MALAEEVGELLEIFQWLTPAQSEQLDDAQLRALEAELADILQYVIRMADVTGVDLAEALSAKLQENAERYPADEVRGSAEKR
jgi:NTP pyrophosphatase (non-canonical NTP hydrolase)